jgi:chromosome segregation ATPase
MEEKGMEATIDAVRERPSYRSPRRVLVDWFRKSRDSWKQKFMERKAELKRFKNRAYDLEKSKERWKTQATLHQRQVEALQAEVERLKAQVSEVEDGSGTKNQPASPR